MWFCFLLTFWVLVCELIGSQWANTIHVCARPPVRLYKPCQIQSLALTWTSCQLWGYATNLMTVVLSDLCHRVKVWKTYAGCRGAVFSLTLWLLGIVYMCVLLTLGYKVVLWMETEICFIWPNLLTTLLCQNTASIPKSWQPAYSAVWLLPSLVSEHILVPKVATLSRLLYYKL